MAVIAISTCAYLDLPLATALERIAVLGTAAEIRCKGRHGIDTVTQTSPPRPRTCLRGPCAGEPRRP